MKRFYFLAILSICFFRFFSQSVLTNGLVYNYSVGDTIKYYTQYNAGPSVSYTMTFIQKVVKTDTLLYQIKEQYYQWPSCMTCSATTGVNTYSYQVTDLNANAAHFTLTNTVCTTQYDSSYTNGCGQTVNFRQNNWGPTCFEPDMYKSYLIEGVGLFYQYIYGQDPSHYTNTKTLTYYHKFGQTPCDGNGMPMGINSANILKYISVYPNPVTHQIIHINNDDKLKLLISISSIDGKVLYEATSDNELIEIHKEFDSGIYFIKLQNQLGESSIKKFVVE